MAAPAIAAPPASETTAARPPASRWLTAGLLAVLALALGLRLVRLGDGLWFDEIQTLVEHARLPVAQIVTTFTSQNQHPLYSLLAHGSMAALGESAATLRLPAVLFGVLGVWGLYRLGGQVIRPAEGLLLAALLAVAAPHIWFSQNARGYTGLLAGALFGTEAFRRLLKERDAGWGVVLMYAGSVGLSIYTHSTAAFLLAAHGLIWLVVRGRLPQGGRRAFAALLGAGILAALCYGPVLPRLIPTLAGDPHPANSVPVTIAWKSPLWLVGEMLAVLARAVPGGYLGLGLGAVVGLTGLVWFWRHDRVTLALFLLPAVVTVAVVVGLHHNLWPRFFFFSAGFALIIGVRGAVSLGERVASERGRTLALAGGVLAVLGGLVLAPRAWGPKQDYEGAVRFVEANAAPADARAVVDLAILPVQQWLGRDWPAVGTVGALDSLAAVHPRTWVMTTFPIRLQSVAPELAGWLHQRYDTMAVFHGTVNGGDIAVLASRPGAGE
ncbi:MAG: glycosyltransferase family 39 protein [Gemmatimonadota bacterium]|nr:glycosyltransferase family 39 protein [Gemmatimonadota bacterium]